MNSRRRLSPEIRIGLTADETSEFERLDQLSPVDHLGNCAWDFEGDPKTADEKRWLELYRKREIAVGSAFAALQPALPSGHRPDVDMATMGSGRKAKYN